VPRTDIDTSSIPLRFDHRPTADEVDTRRLPAAHQASELNWRWGVFLIAGRVMEVAMINFLGCSVQGIAVANGATTLALLEHLVERKILTCRDARAILTNGIDCLEPRSNVRTVAEAVHLMRDHMLPLFSEGGSALRARDAGHDTSQSMSI